MNINHWGIHPRSLFGLFGILTAPLLHANLYHIISNTIPLFILSFLVFEYYKKHSFTIIVFIIVAGGALTWLFARNANHIGASGLIYGLASFIIYSGFLRKDIKLIIISVVTLMLYGGLFWGLFPSRHMYISWEGHLFGALAGLVISRLLYKVGGDED